MCFFIGSTIATGLVSKDKVASAIDIIFTALALILFTLTFTMNILVDAVLTVLVWGAFAFGNVPGLQVYVVKLAKRYTPNAVDVALGLNIAAFNIGIALGSVLRGAIGEGMELRDTARL